jgi:hypothetical protein
MKLLFLVIPIILFGCSDAQDLAAQEVEKKAIDKLKSEIVVLAESSICSEDNDCNFVGLGSKPCGGHWEYLVYSNSIDTIKFLAKVEDCNRLENEFNQKWGIISDCSFVVPPDSVICENGKCKAMYSN